MTSPLLEWTTQASRGHRCPNWPALPGSTGSTASRHQVASLLESGHLAATTGGRLLRPRDRVLAVCCHRFPQRHSHSSEGYYHDHNPFHPEWEDHRHPGFFISHSGAELLWSRLDFIEIAYPLAPAALMGDGARWTHDGRPRRLISWRWLRNTRFVHAVATYEDGYILFFCWGGRSVTAPMLQAQYDSRRASGPARSGCQNLRRTGTVRSASGKNMAGGESRRQPSGTARIERADRRVCGDDRDAAGFMIRVSSRMTFRRMELSQHRKAVEGQVLLRSSCQGAPGLAFDEQPVPFIELAQSSPEGLTGSGATLTTAGTWCGRQVPEQPAGITRRCLSGVTYL